MVTGQDEHPVALDPQAVDHEGREHQVAPSSKDLRGGYPRKAPGDHPQW